MTLEEFQAESSRRVRANGRKPRPYSAEAREFALSFAETQKASGVSRKSVSETLGISNQTLVNWMGHPGTKKAGILPVSIENGAAKGDVNGPQKA
jgi:transposase